MNLGGPRERPLFLAMWPTSSAELRRYWRAVRAPRYSITFAFPLLLAYEALAFLLSRFDEVGVRNGADVLLKRMFVAFGGRYGLAVFGVVLIGCGAALVWRDVRRAGGIQPRWFMLMALESVTYGLVFGSVAGSLTGFLLALGQAGGMNLPVQLMISLGAGIYEELLFRVLLVSGLALLGMRILRWSRTAANAGAVLLGALIFSAFHYVGAYGEPFALASFTFRTVAGLLFSALYVLRGFGITAWTHALYDVFLLK
jgi:membrane protease YdiL (CAAX protease family)